MGERSTSGQPALARVAMSARDIISAQLAHLVYLKTQGGNLIHNLPSIPKPNSSQSGPERIPHTIMQSTTHAMPTSHLLLLPLELRETIYQYAWGPNQIEFRISNQPYCCIAARHRATHIHNKALHRGLPTWLRVCKQVCHEALAVLSRTHVFGAIKGIIMLKRKKMINPDYDMNPLLVGCIKSINLRLTYKVVVYKLATVRLDNGERPPMKRSTIGCLEISYDDKIALELLQQRCVDVEELGIHWSYHCAEYTPENKTLMSNALFEAWAGKLRCVRIEVGEHNHWGHEALGRGPEMEDLARRTAVKLVGGVSREKDQEPALTISHGVLLEGKSDARWYIPRHPWTPTEADMPWLLVEKKRR